MIDVADGHGRGHAVVGAHSFESLCWIFFCKGLVMELLMASSLHQAALLRQGLTMVVVNIE